jgi:hypothetical protein
MPQQLPCPNPACKHVFSAKEIQAAELVKCPKCGRAFRFRQPGAAAPASPKPGPAKPAPLANPVGKPAPRAAKPAPKPPAPMGKPAASPVPRPPAPRAAPVAPPPVTPVSPPPPDVPEIDVEPLDEPADLAEAAVEPDEFVSGEDAGPLVRSRGVVKNRWGAKHFIVLGMAVIALGVLLTCAILYGPEGFRQITGFGGGDDRLLVGRVRNLENKDEKTFKLALPQESWVMDKDLRTRFKAVTAWKSNTEERSAWFALAVQDYGQQRPREAELMKAAVDGLQAHFGDALELSNKATPATLGGQEGMSLKFKGTANSVHWEGEAYMLAYHGFGYWLYIAAPSWAEAATIKAELEKNFTLDTDRRGWTEQPPKMEAFTAAAAPLSLSVPAAVWEKTNAKDEEVTGELFLFGRFQREKDNRKNAALLVFTIDKKSDLAESMKEARNYIEKRKQEENMKYKLAPAEEGADVRSEQVGDRPGRLLELKLLHGDEPKRYYLLAVVHHGEKAFVARCDCVWEHRQIWRQEFLNALGTMRFSKE